mgnify:CR=1 FL=1
MLNKVKVTLLVLLIVKIVGVATGSPQILGEEVYIENLDYSVRLFRGLESVDTGRSSFVKGAWYDDPGEFLVLKLNDKYYQYCDVKSEVWQGFVDADSFGEYYNDEVKGRFNC